MVHPLSTRSADFINKLLPYQSHFIAIAGHQMHYLDEGPRTAPIVILLHGNPTWCFFFRHLVEALRHDFRVIVPDYIGCGLSDHPANVHFRATHRIDHIQTLVEHLNIQRFSLVMHDWGGSIGTGLALRNVAAVEKLVYLNTTLTETESLPRAIKTAAKPLIGKFFTKYTRHFLKLTTTPGFGVYHKLPKEVRKGYLYPYLSSARRTAIWDFVGDIPFNDEHPTYHEMLDLADKLPQLAHVPVQIVWGLRDPCFHREMLNKVAEHFPQAGILEIADASHLVLEDARELSNSTIRDFLLKAPGRVEVQRYDAMTHGQTTEINALYESFLHTLEGAPQQDGVIMPSFLFNDPTYRHVSLKEMGTLIAKYQRGLSNLGLAAEDRVLMLVSPGVEFLALSYAVFACGATPVFLDPGMGRENLFKCIKLIKPHVFIGSPRAQLLRLRRKKLFPELKFHITASEWFYAGGPTLSFLKKFLSRPLPAAPVPRAAMIAFTSGATGFPKGVVFTNSMLREQLRIFREELKLEPGKIDLPLLPVFSLFSLAIGVTSAFPPMDPAHPLRLEPDKIVRIIEDLKVDYSFGSPTLWNKIAEYCIRTHYTLRSLKQIFMAGAPVPVHTLQRLQPLLSRGTSYTPYGSTEALPCTLVTAQAVLGLQSEPARSGEIGAFVGAALKGVELRIMRTEDRAVPDLASTRCLEPFEIGEVIVRGKNISPEYFQNPEATAAAKIRDGDSFWHRMGDMGYLDRQGNLYFCGRKAHALTVAGRVYYSVPVERIFNTHDKVRRSALVSIAGGREAAIVIEPHPQFWPESAADKEIFTAELLRLAASDRLTAEINKIFFHPSFPVDARHNAKIFRDKLGQWAARQPYLERAA